DNADADLPKRRVHDVLPMAGWALNAGAVRPAPVNREGGVTVQNVPGESKYILGQIRPFRVTDIADANIQRRLAGQLMAFDAGVPHSLVVGQGGLVQRVVPGERFDRSQM